MSFEFKVTLIRTNFIILRILEENSSVTLMTFRTTTLKTGPGCGRRFGLRPADVPFLPHVLHLFLFLLTPLSLRRTEENLMSLILLLLQLLAFSLALCLRSFEAGEEE